MLVNSVFVHYGFIFMRNNCKTNIRRIKRKEEEKITILILFFYT